jgi:hypothetical protein
VVVVLGHRHLGQQSGRWDALVDHLRGHGGRSNRLAARAGVFAADVAQHEELGRYAVQLLADLFADALEGLPAGAVGLGDLVAVLDTGQACRQRLAHGLTLGARVGCNRLVDILGRPVLKRGVGQDGVKQHRLRAGVQALAGGAKAPALESRDLEVQGINSGLLELEFALQALQQIAQLLQRLG